MELDTIASLPAAFFQISKLDPDRIVYEQARIEANDSLGQPRAWFGRTYAEVRARVIHVAKFLKSAGVKKGDRVAILSASRPEWMEADLAILSLGAVSVSIYQSLPAEDVGYILYDSESHFVFAENQEQVDKLVELLNGPIHIPGTEEREPTTGQVAINKIISFESVKTHDLVVEFNDVCAGQDPADLEEVNSIHRDDLAAFVYTSGTTGPPKGVIQTHANHLSNVRQVLDCELIGPDSKIMLFLPLAHSFAKLMGYLGFLTEASLKFPGIADTQTSKIQPESVTKDISEGGATIVPVVPRLLEKMQAGIAAKACGSGLGAKILSLVLWSAQGRYRAQKEGRTPGMLLQLCFQGTSSIRAKVKAKLFGQAFDFAVSGGAKLNPRVAEFFDALEIEIVEGYGLTETCVATNVNLPGRKKIGTVGPTLTDDIEIRIADDGEILFRGPNIAVGYHNRKVATDEAWRNGWFHTGDLGAIDDDGYLSIVGRKKEIIVTSYGKNVAPEDIEAQVKSSPYISQVVLLGDGRPYCVALVTLDMQGLRSWVAKAGINASAQDLASQQKVKDLIWSEVEKVNADLASYESVKKVDIVPEEFTVDNGMLTPTFKVKRGLVIKQYGEMIEALYA